MTVRLFSRHGQLFSFEESIGGNSVQEIDLAERLSGPNGQFMEGSIEVLYEGQPIQIGSQLLLFDDQGRLLFDEQLVDPSSFTSAELSGVWIIPPGGGEISVALANVTNEWIDASLSAKLRRQSARISVRLGPRESRRIRLPELSGGFVKAIPVGILVSYPGPPGALVGRGHFQNRRSHSSIALPLVDPASRRSSSWHGHGLREGEWLGHRWRPIVALWNIGTETSIVRARVGNQPEGVERGANLESTISLPPGELALVEDEDPLARTDSRPYTAPMAALPLEITFSTPPSTIAAFAASISEDGRVFPIPVVDPKSVPSSAGGFPFTISDDKSTYIHLKNTSDEPQLYRISLNYKDGSYSPGLRSLGPHEGVTLDLKQWAKLQVSDEDGRTLPRIMPVLGQVLWSTYGASETTVLGWSEHVNHRNLTSSNYSCANCCPDSFFNSLLEHSVVGNGIKLNPREQDKNCYGTVLPPFDITFASFNSDDSSVFTIDVDGTIQYAGTGETQGAASWTSQIYRYVRFEGHCFSSPFIPIPGGNIFTPILVYKKTDEFTDSFGRRIGRYERCNAGSHCRTAAIPAHVFNQSSPPEFVIVNWLTFSNVFGTSCFGITEAVATKCFADPLPAP